MRSSRTLRRAVQPRPTRLNLEMLESRLTPYSVSGNAWLHPELITVGFVPDGTVLSGSGPSAITSNLISSFNTKFGSSAWQNQILKAAQQFAAQTNINFAFLADGGANAGSGSYQQGDAVRADIRIGGYNFGNPTLATAYMPPPINNYSISGDITFNVGQTFNIGSTFDLFTVAMHEFGHALGLNHGASTSVMAASYPGTKTVLTADDISGIRAIYSAGNPRASDAFDAVASNGSFATATNLTGSVGANLTALVENLDVTSSTDKDYYQVTVPSGTSGTMQVRIHTANFSLTTAKVTVYAPNQITVKGIGSITGFQGGIATVNVTGVSAGETYYLKVEGVDSTPMSMGKYALTLNFGTNPTPTPSVPNTQTVNGSPLSNGGGVAQGPVDGIEVFHPEGHDDHETHEPTGGESRFASSFVSVSWGVRAAHTLLTPEGRSPLADTTSFSASIIPPPAPTSSPSPRIFAGTAKEASEWELLQAAPAAAPTPSSASPANGQDDRALDGDPLEALLPQAADVCFAAMADEPHQETRVPEHVLPSVVPSDLTLAAALAFVLGAVWTRQPLPRPGRPLIRR